MSLVKRLLLICTAATMFLLAEPPQTTSRAEARDGRDRYWRNYWGWYDRSYRPYYNRGYRRYNYGYRGYPRSYYGYPNYGYGYRYGYPYSGGYYGGYAPYNQVQIGLFGVYWR
jgi:hypothetical protein